MLCEFITHVTFNLQFGLIIMITLKADQKCIEIIVLAWVQTSTELNCSYALWFLSAVRISWKSTLS